MDSETDNTRKRGWADCVPRDTRFIGRGGRGIGAFVSRHTRDYWRGYIEGVTESDERRLRGRGSKDLVPRDARKFCVIMRYKKD